jgi:cytochrome c-type biogenesis protein CcmE
VKKAYIIAFLVIGVAMGFTMWAFSSAMTPYVDIKTARTSTTPVQVKGKILHETVRWENNALHFRIEDKNHEQIEVVYKGAKPEAFDTAPETAADGVVTQENGQEVFVSSRMVVKCPSKYDDSKKPAPQTAATGAGV